MAGLDSGIKLHNDTVAAMDAIEKNKLGYIIMQIDKAEGEKVDKVVIKEKFTNDECVDEVKKLGIELKGDETPTWYCFRKHLEAYDIAYGCAFIRYKSTDQRDVDKLVYVMWNTEKAKLKQKMSYASTKVSQKFKNLHLKHQAADPDDISYNEIVINKFGRK